MALEPKLIALKTLVAWMWADNPKLHQDTLIQNSMSEYGFNDRVEVCSEFELVMAGHGRITNLGRMKAAIAGGDTSVKIPDNIVVEGDDWLVPCDDHVGQFDSRERAYQYALVNNRSGNTALDLRDYDITRLQKAINAASAGAQMGFELPGFGVEDFSSASTSQGIPAGTPGSPESPALGGVAQVGQLPKASVFDPSALPDAPGYQDGQAPQSYVVMVTAPDAEGFMRVLRTLSMGERKNLPEGTRFATLESTKFINEWERYLVAKEAIAPLEEKINLSVGQPLPGQITLAGVVVGETPLKTEDLVVGASEPVNKPLTISEPREPEWDADGNCENCGGRGHKGTRNVSGKSYPVFCSICDGSGTQVIWRERHSTPTITSVPAATMEEN